MQKLTLIGNIGSIGFGDEKLRKVNDTSVVNFSVAVNKKYTNRNGDRVESTTWFACEAWGKTAENLVQYKKVGDQIYVEGEIRFDKAPHKDHADIEMTYPKVRALFIEYLGNGGSNGTNGSSTQERVISSQEAESEEIPF
jgi:single-strand DNA-binding protein